MLQSERTGPGHREEKEREVRKTVNRRRRKIEEKSDGERKDAEILISTTTFIWHGQNLL